MDRQDERDKSGKQLPLFKGSPPDRPGPSAVIKLLIAESRVLTVDWRLTSFALSILFILRIDVKFRVFSVFRG